MLLNSLYIVLQQRWWLVQKYPQKSILFCDDLPNMGLQLIYSSTRKVVAGPNAKFSTPGAAVGLFCHTPGIPLARYIHIDNKALITRILFVLYIISSLHGHKKVFFFRRVPRAVSGYMLLTGLPIGKGSKVTTSGCLKVSHANGTGMIPMKQHFQICPSQHLWKL